MELDRQRTRAALTLAGVPVIAAIMVGSAARGGEIDGFVLAGTVGATIVGVGYGSRLLVENSRRRRAFESQHGVGAGRQEPI